MSGQPPGGPPSGARPVTNGVTGGIAAPSQQVGSSTGNGPPGAMSQSNLNSIVRNDFLIAGPLLLNSALFCIHLSGCVVGILPYLSCFVRRSWTRRTAILWKRTPLRRVTWEASVSSNPVNFLSDRRRFASLHLDWSEPSTSSEKRVRNPSSQSLLWAATIGQGLSQGLDTISQASNDNSKAFEHHLLAHLLTTDPVCGVGG